jgi:hypothetical protein
MGLSVVVGGVAVPVGLLALAVRPHAPWPVTAALLWAALSGCAVAVCAANDRLAARTTGLLMKDPSTGSIGLASRALFAPYHLALRGKLLVQFARGAVRAQGGKAAAAAAADGAAAAATATAPATPPPPLREPLFNEIVPGLYVGGWPRRRDQVPAGASVLDVTCELPRVPQQQHGSAAANGDSSGGGSGSSGSDAEARPLRQRRAAAARSASSSTAGPASSSARYLNLPVWDTHAPTPQAIDRAVAWALAERRAGRGVYVHCAHGHGRSATVAGAVLIASGAARDASDAVRVMQAARPRVRLNRRQAAALDGWLALRAAGGGAGKGGGGGVEMTEAGTCSAAGVE